MFYFVLLGAIRSAAARADAGARLPAEPGIVFKATMLNRNGNSLEFLRKLTCAKVIQVNWYYIVNKHAPNYVAYRNVRQVMHETGRDWAIAEHMTLNGTDYPAADVPAMLRTAIQYSTNFSFEFVDVAPGGDFSMYEKGWIPKPAMAVVDDHWNEWMKEVKAHAAARGGQP